MILQDGYTKELYKQAKEEEKNHNWLDAAQIWTYLGQKDDADACMLIHESNERGNLFRSKLNDQLRQQNEQ